MTLGKERRLVCTLCIGDDFSALGSITHPFQREYARSVSADYRVISEAADQTGVPGLEKLQFVEFFEDYDRILFLDTDILVVPGAEDVFSLVGRGQFGATIVFGNNRPRVPAAVRIEQDMSVAATLFGRPKWQGIYFNSGVMVADRYHRPALEFARSRAAKWAAAEGRLFMDQTLLNFCIWEAGLEVKDLGFRFNHTPAFGHSSDRFRSHFVHYAGHRGHRRGERIRQVALDAWLMRHPSVLRVVKRFPEVVSVFDKI